MGANTGPTPDISSANMGSAKDAQKKKEAEEHVVMYCDHKIDGTPRNYEVGAKPFEVVPSKDGKDKVTILYKCKPGNPPGSLTVTSPIEMIVTDKPQSISKKGEERGHGKYELPILLKTKEALNQIPNTAGQGAAMEFAQISMITALLKCAGPFTYTVKGSGRAIPINVYQPGKVLLDVTIPSLFGGEPMLIGQDNRSGTFKATPKKELLEGEDPDFNFSLKIDNWVPPLTQIWRLVTPMIKLVKGVYQLINSVPKFGFYTVFRLECFAGNLKVEYGYKEWKDYQVFFAWMVQGELKVIDISFELGFGFEACSVTAVVYILFQGTMSWKGTVKRDRPDKEVTRSDSTKSVGNGKETTPTKTTIQQIELAFARELSVKAEVGAKVQVGEFIEAKVAAEVGLLFGIEVGFRRGSGFTCAGQVKYTGAKASLIFQVGKGSGAKLGYKFVKEWEWGAEKKLCSFEFPKEEEYVPPWISYDQVFTIARDYIQNKNLRIAEPYGMFYKNSLSTPDAAHMLAKALDKHKKVQRDKESVDRFIQWVVDDLKLMEISPGMYNFVPRQTFETYVSKTVPGMVKKMKDVGAEITEKIKGKSGGK